MVVVDLESTEEDDDARDSVSVLQKQHSRHALGEQVGDIVFACNPNQVDIVGKQVFHEVVSKRNVSVPVHCHLRTRHLNARLIVHVDFALLCLLIPKFSKESSEICHSLGTFVQSDQFCFH